MKGYLNEPKLTAESFDAEGWYHTGDIVIHEEGSFTVVDRLKNLIKVKGFQVQLLVH